MRALWGAVLLLLGTIGDCLTEQVRLAPPSHVRFYSVDYKTSLLWTPPSNSSSLKHYVQWKIYGEPQWLDVDHCQGVEEPECDLSEVTSDITEWYYARVHSSSSADKSAWTTSPRFSPRWDSKISPPLLRVNATHKGIVVRVKSTHTQVRKKHRDLYYKIYLTRENGLEEELEMASSIHKLAVKDTKRKTKYCFQGQTVLPRQARVSVRSEATCITSK